MIRYPVTDAKLRQLVEDEKSGWLARAAARSAAKQTVAYFLKPKLNHLNCAKSFTRLFDTNPGAAKTFYAAALKLITTSS